MKKLVSIILVLLVIGISPVVSLAGEEKGAIKIVNMTSILLLQDAGNQLKRELELALQRMGFDLNYQKFQYQLKFKIMKFNEGNQIGRLFSFGLSDSSRGKLETKVALYYRGSMVGAWEVNSWVSGGVTGGSLNNVFESATEEIIEKVKSVYPLAEQKHYALKQKGASDKLARERRLLEEERKRLEARKNIKEADRLARERLLLEEERKRLEARRLAEENGRQQQSEEKAPQSGNDADATNGWLGVMIQKITPELAKSFGLNQSEGAMVGDVIPDGPAFKAGIQRGDVIVTFDGKDVKDMEDLPKILARINPGNIIEVKVIREGRVNKIMVTIQENLYALEQMTSNDFNTSYNLGFTYLNAGKYEEAIASLKKAVLVKPDDAKAHASLGLAYKEFGRNDEAIKEYIEALRIDPNDTYSRNNLNKLEQMTADERLESEQLLTEADERLESEQRLLEEERKRLEAQKNNNEADRLARERKLLEEERKQWEARRLAEENRRQQSSEEQAPQSGTGSGFFVSKMGHVITNAHVVQNCKKITIGDNANKQVPAELINTDRSNDLALLKLSTLEMASAESKSLIQKLSIVVVPLASKGLLRSEDVRLGEKVLVAGYPFGDAFSNTIKVTTGVVSATRGAGDNSGQFQLDAAVQPGNSGGPIYDSGGNIVGVVISQLNKKTFGSLVENVNFGVKASTVRQFLVSSGLSSKKAEQTEEKSTEQLAEIAQNQALMVMCL